MVALNMCSQGQNAPDPRRPDHDGKNSFVLGDAVGPQESVRYEPLSQTAGCGQGPGYSSHQ